MSKHTERSPFLVRVGTLGLGTVGCGVAEVLMRHGDLIAQRTGIQLKIVRAFVRDTERARHPSAAHIPLTSRAEDITTANDVDIVVELLGGIEPARSLILKALQCGKPVVTANKAVLAAHGGELFEAAAQHATDIYFEAAVAGGIPIIRTLREGLVSDKITRIRGILNGTTNFILSLMEQGASYEDAVALAQERGYAEADPTLDVNGRDAADKLAILCRLAFGTAVHPGDIPTQGIQNLSAYMLREAQKLGYRIKLIACAQRVQGDKELLDVRVSPTLVPEDHPLSTVPDSQNAVSVLSDALGTTHYQGAGAGALPTGSAVVADLIDAARNRRADVHGRVALERAKSAPVLLQPELSIQAFYVQLVVEDKPGVLARVTQVFAQENVSLATVLQQGRATGPHDYVTLILSTHPCPRGALDRVLQTLKTQDAVKERIEALPILADAGPYAAKS